MGMTKMQLMKDVELPLALPLIISGIRLSSVYVVLGYTCKLRWCRWLR